MANKIIRRRKRKSYEQLQMLIKEFQANPEWSKDNMHEVSRKTGLSEAQVYKWGWDQRRKMMDPTHDIHAELRMYKRDEESDDEEESTVHKFKLPISNKKQRKDSSDCHSFNGRSDEKSHTKAKKPQFGATASKESKDNKENEYSKNYSNGKPETRGVKRKLKALGMSNRQNV